MRPIGNQLPNRKRFSLRPRFTVVHHPIRIKFGLTINTYTIIDSIHHLSHRPDHPWCTQSKADLGDFVDLSERQVFRATKEGIEKGLLEKNDRGDLRSSNKWIEQVVLYSNREINKE